MTRQNPPGRPTDLTPALMEHILSFVESNYTQTQVARLSCVPQSRISDWLSRGMKDAEEGRDTIFAQFSIKFQEKIGLDIQDMLRAIRSLGSFQALSWLLENCFREEFGKEAGIIQKILDQQEKILGLKEKGENDATR